MAVEVGEEAPDFELTDQDRQVVRLSSYRGRKNVVLVFYPYAFTRVCGAEMCAIRDELPALQNDDVEVLAVSVDSARVHQAWAEQEGFTFPHLADFWPHGGVAQAYGIFDDALGVALRGTFIIDKAGIVRYQVVNAIPDAREQAAYLRVLDEL